MQIDQATIQEAVIARLADDVVDGWRWHEELQTAVKQRVDKLFDAKVQSILDDAVSAAVSAGFDHAYQRVDNFGKPIGEPTTVRKELDKLIQDYWSQRVDRAGKATDSTYGTTTRAQWTMAQVCGQEFSELIKSNVVSTAGAFKDGIRAQLREHVDQMLSQMFRVRSADDQKENRYVP